MSKLSAKKDFTSWPPTLSYHFLKVIPQRFQIYVKSGADCMPCRCHGNVAVTLVCQ